MIYALFSTILKRNFLNIYGRIFYVIMFHRAHSNGNIVSLHLQKVSIDVDPEVDQYQTWNIGLSHGEERNPKPLNT